MMYVYYTFRFNPFIQEYQVLEHWPQLEKTRVLHKMFRTERECKEFIKLMSSLEDEDEEDIITIGE